MSNNLILSNDDFDLNKWVDNMDEKPSEQVLEARIKFLELELKDSTDRIGYLENQNNALMEENDKLRDALAQETYETVELKKCIDMLSPKFNTGYSTDLNKLSSEIHNDNVKAGWWTDLATGKPLDRNVGELLCLVHSEISEAMEGYRKDLMDDKLPHRKGFEVELADALIRIFDIAGKFNLDLDGAIAEKREYNAKRSDHKLENRQGMNGKKF